MKEVIVIYRNGNEVKAYYKKGEKVEKVSKARCNPEDEFNFKIGARLAFNRLVHGTDYAPGEVAFIKPKPYNGRVVCIASDVEWWTVGKIYTLKNGYIIDNDGDITGPYMSVGHVNNLSGDFVEVIE